MSTDGTPARRRRGTKADPEAVGKLTAPRKRLAPAAVVNPVTGKKVAGSTRSKTKLTSWMDTEDAAQVRAAFLATRGLTPYRSLTDMINRAVMREVGELQQKYNKGKAWPPAKPGDVPTGRPL